MDDASDPDFDALVHQANQQAGNVVPFRSGKRRKKKPAEEGIKDAALSESIQASFADQLIAYVRPRITEYVRDGVLGKPGVTPYARIKTTSKADSPEALLEVGSAAFSIILEVIWAESVPDHGLPEEALKTVVRWARSQCFGPNSKTVEVFYRVAGDRYFGIDIDLGDDKQQMVRVAKNGIEVISHAKGGRYFRRGAGTLALPIPNLSGELQMLRPFVGLEGVQYNREWALLASSAVMSVWPHGPYPHTQLIGEKGSRKTSTAQRVRSIADPDMIDTQRPPREIRDLRVRVRNSRIVILDNVSKIGAELSDTLCGFSTGEGHAERKLRTNVDEEIYATECPVFTTALENQVKKDDLADRTVTIVLPRPAIHDTRENVLKEWERIRPSAFGGLLRALQAAIVNYDDAEKRKKSDQRLADYAVVARAAESEYGVNVGTWELAYAEMRNDMHEDAAESVLARAIIHFARENPEANTPDGWSGKKEALLALITATLGNLLEKPSDWPKNPSQLGAALRSLRCDLRSVGVEVDPDARLKDNNRTRVVSVKFVGKPSPQPSNESAKPGATGATPATALQNQGFSVAGGSCAVATRLPLPATAEELDV